MTPTTFDLGPVPLGRGSGEAFVTITNVGLGAVPAWPQAAPSNADFAYETDRSGALAAGASCSYGFVFTPSTLGREHATTAIVTTVGSFALSSLGTGTQSVA